MAHRHKVNTLNRISSKSTAARMALVLAAGIAVLVLGHASLSNADTPQGKTPPERTANRPPRHAVRLVGGDEGPFFSLQDLARYTPIPRPPTQRRAIRPPVWNEYPPELEAIPFIPRAYSTETVEYLAAHEIEHGDRQQPFMALTFDCEAGSASTLQILETLRQEKVRATFFILGRYAYLYPEIVRQVVQDGHEIGNHSFFHPLFTATDPMTATLEVRFTEAAVDWAVGQHVPMRYIRFPYGGRNRATLQHAAQMGYQSAFWDIDPRGWEPEKTPEDVVATVRHSAHNGGIVIMHCVSWNDANALMEVIRIIRETGRTPGTLTDVLTQEDWDVPGCPKVWPQRAHDTQ